MNGPQSIGESADLCRTLLRTSAEGTDSSFSRITEGSRAMSLGAVLSEC